MNQLFRADIFFISDISVRMEDATLAFLMSEASFTVGRLPSSGITRLHRYYAPLRHPLTFDPLPGVTGYRIYLAPAISHWDEEGFSSFLVHPCQHAVGFTPPKGCSASVRLRYTLLSSPDFEGSTFGV